MSFALSRRLLRRTWPLLVVPCIAAMGVASLFVALIGPLGGTGQLQSLLRFAPRMIREALGAADIDLASVAGIASIAYVHPLMAVLMLLWPLSLASTALAGEIESGEADLVLSRAVSRTHSFWSAAATMIFGAMCVGLMQFTGTCLGSALEPPEPPLPLARFAGAASVNALLMASMGSVFLLLSAMNSERGPVLGWGAGLWALSYFTGVVAPIFPRIAWLSPWSLHSHVRPQSIVAFGQMPWTDSAILAAVALGSLLLAWAIWTRRDISG